MMNYINLKREKEKIYLQDGNNVPYLIDTRQDNNSGYYLHFYSLGEEIAYGFSSGGSGLYANNIQFLNNYHKI